jgi:HEAT repeat protein
LPELRRALSDPDPGVRLQAAQALGQMGDREAIEKLKEALQKETHKEVKEALEKALEQLFPLQEKVR